MTRRYAAFHVSESGFDSQSDVEDWISKQENPDEYYTAAVTDDFKPNKVAEGTRAAEIAHKTELKINHAVRAERIRLSEFLGLTT